MSMSSITSTPLASASLAVQKPPTARAADGDFKAAEGSHMVKDADGDYKPSGAPVSAAATSSGAVLASVASLQKGG